MADLTSQPDESVQCGSARLTRSDGPVEVLTVTGEIDTAEAEELSAIVQPVVTRRGPGILDLSGLAFLSVAGYRALRAWSYQARETGANWVLLAGPAVEPYLRSLGRADVLPIASTAGEALDMLAGRWAAKQAVPIVDADRTVC